MQKHLGVDGAHLLVGELIFSETDRAHLVVRLLQALVELLAALRVGRLRFFVVTELGHTQPLVHGSNVVVYF